MMSVIKNNPTFKNMQLQRIYDYLIERELVLEIELDTIAAKEIKKLLIYLVTNFARGIDESNSYN